jgi:hypothetical protein
LSIRIGRNAFSSKLPSFPPIVTATSEAMTWIATISIASAWVGFTLPGMIEDPGSLDGKISSWIPVRGPDPSQRRSLAILNKLTAAAFRPACARTIRSSVPWAVNLFAAVTYATPVIFAICAATSSPKPAGAFSPVPTAVPPIASCSRPSVACPTSAIASSRAPAYPDHSWPTVSGTASSRWVRPILTTSAHCFDLASMASRSRFSAGIVWPVAIVYAAMCMAVGNVSLDDCPMFT